MGRVSGLLVWFRSTWGKTAKMKHLPVVISKVCLQRWPVKEACDTGDERRGPVVHAGGAVAALYSAMMRQAVLLLRQHPAPPRRGTGQPAAAAGHGRSAANQHAFPPVSTCNTQADDGITAVTGRGRVPPPFYYFVEEGAPPDDKKTFIGMRKHGN